MRNKIKNKLLEIEGNDLLFYGMVPENIDIEEWNYIVFNQSKMKKSGSSSNDLSGYWNVVIVHEDYIPDDLVAEVINKMSEVNGLRLADGDYPYVYTQKGSTNIIVEMLVLQFTKMKKGINLCL